MLMANLEPAMAGLKRSALQCIRIMSASLCCWIITASNAQDYEEADLDFTLKIYPLLKEKCFACHGDQPDEIEGGLNLLTRENMLLGGENTSEALIPGNAEKSAIWKAVTWEDPDLEMPPKENDRLTREQIDSLRDWIDAGAPWPNETIQKQIREAQWAVEETDEGVIVPTSGGQSDTWTYRRYKPEDIWAFRPVQRPAIPGLKSDAVAHPMDAFIRFRQEQEGIKPAPAAEPRTLVRRMYYDLLGLPPSPTELASALELFQNHPDASIAASALVDQLLSSPHYGEQWAQHWLDVARYADTGGMSNDFERSNAWRYRDYVIRSFNNDKPYNQFVIEQIAGDELADESVRQRLNANLQQIHQTRLDGNYTEEESEWIIASGFLRMGPWDNAMVKEQEAIQMYLDDVVNSVGQTFLATTMRCVKCHDHKFDPIPTRDYYRIYAAFSSAKMAERPTPFLKTENLSGFEFGKAQVQRMLDFAIRERDKLIKKRETTAREWFESRNLKYLDINERQDLPDEEKPPRAVGLNHIEQGQLKVREQDVWIWNRRLERYQPMTQSVFSAGPTKLAWNAARKLRLSKNIDPKAELVNVIHQGGSISAPGERVSPGVLSALQVPVPKANPDQPFLTTPSVNGRRLSLARWIASPENPLTARALVNRVWQWHFNQPLAGNPNNFGSKGAKPTHPELLDWLASEFVNNGWSIKQLHKLIMTSQTYRQSSHHPEWERLKSLDPDNHLLAYYNTRRMNAEEIRDSMLKITGELNPTVGGLPVMPEINMEVALAPRMIQFSLAPAYQPSQTPEARNRRTIYAYRVRGLADPFLEVFNKPNPNDSCEARNDAAVSPQVFTMLNSDMISDRSLALAARVENETQDPAEQIQRAFLLTLGRLPDPNELHRMEIYLKDMTDYHQTHQPDPISYPSSITRSLVEEFSGMPFEYEEILPVFENYQADLKPSETAPSTRALADICLLLLNTHEFMLID